MTGSTPKRGRLQAHAFRSDPMTILVFYGSYRSDRLGIRLADFVTKVFARAATTSN